VGENPRAKKDCTFWVRLLMKTYVDTNPAIVECLKTGRRYACRMAESALQELYQVIWRAQLDGCLSEETAYDLLDEVGLTREAIHKAPKSEGGG